LVASRKKKNSAGEGQWVNASNKEKGFYLISTGRKRTKTTACAIVGHNERGEKRIGSEGVDEKTTQLETIRGGERSLQKEAGTKGK